MANKERKMLLQGNEACALGALDAGCRFFAGYPITPSTEIAEKLSEELPKVGGRFIQMEDELGSICACIGASAMGRKSLTSTSGPGFSLMQEGIGYACCTEMPVVIVNVMRGGPSTGLPTAPAQGDVQQARYGSHGDHEIIVLSASTVAECYHQTVRAFNLAEKYRTPVIMLIDEVVAHMRQNVVLPDAKDLEIIDRKHPQVHPDWYHPYDNENQVPVLADFGEGYRYHVTGLIHDENGYPTTVTEEVTAFIMRINRKISENVDDICRIEYLGSARPDVLVVAYGSVMLTAQEAILKVKEKHKLNVGLVRIDTLWPFPDQLLDKLIDKVKKTCKKIVIAEMNFGQVYREIERINRGRLPLDAYFQVNGELIQPDAIYKKITGVKK
ncbi:MAG: 2-oxoacid:acceptor oxidoreductase subunit alpha [Candidatus Wallbacteria bacterium]|nr:2-oxoacid:acceptor oxidoreductase subunit alpha [Candidatus Wallbacteria bacterium]